MNHARVMAALVVADPGLLVDDDQARPRTAAQKLPRHRQPDNPRAHHGKVIAPDVRAPPPDRETVNPRSQASTIADRPNCTARHPARRQRTVRPLAARPSARALGLAGRADVSASRRVTGPSYGHNNVKGPMSG